MRCQRFRVLLEACPGVAEVAERGDEEQVVAVWQLPGQLYRFLQECRGLLIQSRLIGLCRHGVVGRPPVAAYPDVAGEVRQA